MNRRNAVALTLGALAFPAGARADSHYRAGLLAGNKAAGMWNAGVDITLAAGWKTYWRMPGEAGIPPEFDWSKSANLAAVQVLWPAPRRYHDAGGETVGYQERVVFPLLVKPRDDMMPVELALDLFFAVCKDVCVPAKASASLSETASDPAAARLIAAFAAQVPVAVDPKSAWRVSSAAIDDMAGKPALRLDFAGEVPEADIDIFVEGGGSAYFRAPRRAGPSEFYLPVDGLKDKDRLRGQALLLTLVSADIRLEQGVTVA